MDFWTAAAYIGIVVLVLANALIVRRMKVEVRDEEED
jgi:hypothetical protein